MSLKPEAKLAVLLACAGLMACDPAKKVENAQEEQQKVAVEATEKRADLTREQTNEAAALVKDQREERADLEQKQRDTMVGEQKEAVKLGTEQINERTKVEGEIAKDSAEANKELNKATAQLDEKRQELQSKARARLEKITARASNITTKSQTAKPDEKTHVSQVLTGFAEAKATAERDIEALATVAAENFKRAEKAVDNALASLEKKLDKAEDKL